MLWNEKNVGPGISRNKAIALAASRDYPFVLYNDADDLSHPNRLETVRRLLNQALDVSVVYSPFNVIDENNNTVDGHLIPPSIKAIMSSYEHNAPVGADVWKNIVAEKKGYINLTSATSVRTTLASRCLFPPERISEDAVTWMKYSALGGRFAFAESIPSSYRINMRNQKLATQEHEGGKAIFFEQVVDTNERGVKECIEISLKNRSLKQYEVPHLLVRFYINLAEMVSHEKQTSLCKKLLSKALNVSTEETKAYLEHKNMVTHQWIKSSDLL